MFSMLLMDVPNTTIPITTVSPGATDAPAVVSPLLWLGVLVVVLIAVAAVLLVRITRRNRSKTK